MPRKGHVKKRDVLPDAKYNDKRVAKLINQVMLDGKKQIAIKIVYRAFDIVSQKTNKDAIVTFEEALANIMPVLDND